LHPKIRHPKISIYGLNKSVRDTIEVSFVVLRKSKKNINLGEIRSRIRISVSFIFPFEVPSGPIYTTNGSYPDNKDE